MQRRHNNGRDAWQVLHQRIANTRGQEKLHKVSNGRRKHNQHNSRKHTLLANGHFPLRKVINVYTITKIIPKMNKPPRVCFDQAQQHQIYESVELPTNLPTVNNTTSIQVSKSARSTTELIKEIVTERFKNARRCVILLTDITPVIEAYHPPTGQWMTMYTTCFIRPNPVSLTQVGVAECTVLTKAMYVCRHCPTDIHDSKVQKEIKNKTELCYWELMTHEQIDGVHKSVQALCHAQTCTDC